MKTIYYLIWILGIILYIALERKGRARLSNNYNRKVSKNYFIEKKKALNKIFRKNKKEFNKLFQNKRKLHKLILMSIISIPISFFIIYYIFIKINLIKEEAIMFAIEISIILGLVAYLSRISKIGFEVYCENMKFIDDYIYEKTGFKKIEFVSNTNKYLYEKI